MTKKVMMVGVVALLLSVAAFELFAGTRMEAGCWVFLLAAVGCILLLIPACLFSIFRRRRIGFVGLAVVLAGGAWLILSFAAGGDRVISRTTAPDGTEMCVIQAFTGHWSEPYRVEFYYHRPGQQWGSFYYEHEDTRWWLGSLSVASDGRHVTIRRFVLPVAYFDIPTESFTIVRWRRTLHPAQTWMPEGWRPESEVSQRPNQGAAAGPAWRLGLQSTRPVRRVAELDR